MTRIKISSNPYEKKICYKEWDNNIDGWQEINLENNPNSRLLCKDLSEKFFPFCVKDIVDAIYDSYKSSDEATHIEFEGSPDEFEELRSYCFMHPEKNILLEYSLQLVNAKELLPEIIKIFNKVKPLVSEEIRHANPSIDNDLNKFSDASDDIVPLCVVGNYSSGKSSFINALIGKEILPIGDESVTAKVYKIQNSKNKKKASIKFSVFNKSLEILFDSDNHKLETEIDNKNDFLVKFKSVVEGNKGDLASKIRAVLKFINADKQVSDLVEVSIDFSGDFWNALPNSFVIFDTPGSNSALNEKHFQILMESMKGLSNGLPIFVVNNENLETTDNDKLCKDIKGLEALDNRFSMIVVNKADKANLPKNIEEYEVNRISHILLSPVPKNLYSLGIFYLSSFIGLGAKLDGNFYDSEEDLQNTPAEIFEGEKLKYSDPENKYYKSLYKYNIMPEQIKERFKLESENYKKNLLYSNSGLFAIEYAIKLFTEKYSSYNKCSQSRMFLEKIIEKTKNEVDRKKTEVEDRRKELRSEMDNEKKALVEMLSSTRQYLLTDCWKPDYDKKMAEYLEKEKMRIREEAPFNVESFTRLKKDAEKDFDVLGKYLELLIESKIYKSNPLDKENLHDKLYDDPSTRKILDEKKGNVDEESKKRELKQQDKSLFLNKNDDTDKIMREKVSNAYKDYMNKMELCLNGYSIKFWQDKEIELKERYAEIIDNKEIEDKDKNILKNVITEYEEMKFPEYHFGDIVLDVITLGIRVLLRYADKYRSVVFDQADKILPKVLGELKSKHYALFDKWSEALLNETDNHIIEWNPDLKAKSVDISKKTKEIEALESNLNKLEEFNNSIKKKMAL